MLLFKARRYRQKLFFHALVILEILGYQVFYNMMF